MPSGEEGTLEALKCSACNCHRNFHRKEAEGESSYDCYHPFKRGRWWDDGEATLGEEEVQDQVHSRAEGEDASLRREGGLAVSEAGRERGSAVLPGDRGEEESPQGVDAQQQAQLGQEGPSPARMTAAAGSPLTIPNCSSLFGLCLTLGMWMLEF
ncbi:ZF-HD protein dimerization region containing protein [Musa troglodytarum]|uniref:ZF-HD protein dimerization region containing protein n=1 Tax=Musa troglodytarum TaxID=320322 RepID=A0A9E7I1P2_9LILI|nr:ZF-HD protein dimerization region containing protein [Musa troglodytarum]